MINCGAEILCRALLPSSFVNIERWERWVDSFTSATWSQASDYMQSLLVAHKTQANCLLKFKPISPSMCSTWDKHVCGATLWIMFHTEQLQVRAPGTLSARLWLEGVCSIPCRPGWVLVTLIRVGSQPDSVHGASACVSAGAEAPVPTCGLSAVGCKATVPG